MYTIYIYIYQQFKIIFQFLLNYQQLFFLFSIYVYQVEQQILLQANIAFFLGNFNKVLEIWQSNDYEDDYYYFLVSRALVAPRVLKPKTIRLTKKPSSKLLEITDIVNRFMGPLIEQQRADTTRDEDRKQLEDVLKKLKDIIPQQNQKIIQIICAYMSVNSCEAQYALQLELLKDTFQEELLYLQFMIYLRGRRLDLAEQTFLDLRRFDDEDILPYSAQLYLNLYNGQPEQAYKTIQESQLDHHKTRKPLINVMRILILIRKNTIISLEHLSQKNNVSCLLDLIFLSPAFLHQELLLFFIGYAGSSSSTVIGLSALFFNFQLELPYY